MMMTKCFQEVLCEMSQELFVSVVKLPLPTMTQTKFDSPYMRRRSSCRKRR